MGLEVWQAQLSRVEHQWPRFESALSADEVDRAAGMRRESVRLRYIVGRGLLRSLVAERVGLSPAAVRFVYGDSGKPFLDPSQADRIGRPLVFNLSHSADRIVVALWVPTEWDAPCSPDAGIGVDLEWAGRPCHVEAIVRRFATLAERREFASLPPRERRLAFFRWWTRKEALIKAAGASLSQGVGSAEVSFGTGPYVLASFPALDGRFSRLWRLATVGLDDHYIMTVARPLAAAGPADVAAKIPLERTLTPHPTLPVTLVARW